MYNLQRESNFLSISFVSPLFITCDEIDRLEIVKHENIRYFADQNITSPKVQGFISQNRVH